MCGAFSSDKLLINMKKLAFFLILLFSGIFSAQVWSIDLEPVSLQEISTTGRSLIIDRGSLENFGEGSIARFYVQKGPKEFPKIFLVAEGELIKSFPKKSYWYLKVVTLPDAIKKDSKLLILTMDQINSGRSFKARSKTVVRSTKDYESLEDFLDKNKTNVPDRLVKEGKNYEASPDIYERPLDHTRPAPEVDALLTNYETYKVKLGNNYSEEYGDLTQEKYFVGNQEMSLGDVRKTEDKKLFESVHLGMVEKVNGMKYGLKGFYADQEKLKEMPDVSIQGTNASVYEEYKAQEKVVSRIKPKVAAKMKRDGGLWTADMDDVTLRRYFIESGLEKEIRRRDHALNELDGHEIMVHYSGGLSTHGNADDPNYQGRGVNYGIGYDMHLSKISADLKKWSLQFVLEKEQTQYNTGVYNARSNEFLYGVYGNYYFINNPLTLNSMIYSAGIGIKGGSSKIAAATLSKEYSYQVLALPALQLMGKYRFRTGDLREDNLNIGMSFNFGINFDVKSLTTNESLDDDINGKISVNDLKYTLGMSLYF